MSGLSLDVYKQAIIDSFSFLKSATNIQDAFLRAIPIESVGFLVPIGKVHLEDSDLINTLTEWRNTHVHVYPTQFLATPESTRNWMLDRLLAVDDRLLFLVVDNQGKAVGHMGFNGCFNKDQFFEIDNIVRGSMSASKGLFSRALATLINWARVTMPVNGFFLRVMSDNSHAIRFYEKNGFVEDMRIPLMSEEKEGLISYRECQKNEMPVTSFIRFVYASPSQSTIPEKMILTAGPSISSKEAVYAFDAALNGWNRDWSGYLTRFEKEFAKYVGVKYAFATSSCTGALQIALMALDIGPGDEVIVPDQTWVATANAVRYVGAIPVFADIEIDTWNMDPISVEKLITPKTKAIIPVHMYGHPARMTQLMAVAAKHGLKVVEDAAPAIGAEWEGKRCGSFGDFAAFSFQGAKLMVTGEGGMLVTNSDVLYQKALKIWDQGRDPSRTFWIDGDGVKFKMSNIQAALGLAQLERVDALIEMKRRLFSWYEECLSGIPGLYLNKEVVGARSIYWMSSIRLDESLSVSRDSLILALRERQIDTRPVFPAISQYPIWPRKSLPQSVAYRVGNQALNLPSGVCLKKEDVVYAAKTLVELLNR